MARPVQIPEWAKSGTRIEPGSALKANGVAPGDFFAAENANYMLGVLSDWIEYAAQPREFVVRALGGIENWSYRPGSSSTPVRGPINVTTATNVFNNYVEITSGSGTNLFQTVSLLIPLEDDPDVYRWRVTKMQYICNAGNASNEISVYLGQARPTGGPVAATLVDQHSEVSGSTLLGRDISLDYTLNGGSMEVSVNLDRSTGTMRMGGLLFTIERSLL